MKRFIIHDPIYDVEYLIQVGGSVRDAIRAYAKKLGIDPWEVEERPHRRGMFFVYDSFPQGGLWLHESAWAGIVAHECFHAVAYTMQRLHIPLREDTEEAFAYYLQWMLNQILPKMEVWKGYAEHVGKKKKKK